LELVGSGRCSCRRRAGYSIECRRYLRNGRGDRTGAGETITLANSNVAPSFCSATPGGSPALRTTAGFANGIETPALPGGYRFGRRRRILHAEGLSGGAGNGAREPVFGWRGVQPPLWDWNDRLLCDPALKHWATFGRPYGASGLHVPPAEGLVSCDG